MPKTEDMSLADMCERVEFSEAIANLSLSNQHTLDMPYLNMYNGHPVFVYGTLKTGQVRDSILTNSNACFVSTACTNEAHLMLRTKSPAGWGSARNSNNFPILFEHMSASVDHQAAVFGELWVVDTTTLSLLDTIEGNPHMFKRKTKPIQILSKPQHTRFQLYEVCPAWIYMGVKNYWSHLWVRNELDTVLPDFLETGACRKFLNFTQ